MASVFVENQALRNGEELSRSERQEQLERIVTSSHFRNSKRYPSFLRFVVERTIEENAEILKERNLGVEVFGRPSDYDTNSDPIVRVTAGEVRKRIAQYYQTPGHEHELRIDLPIGSYVPHFYPASLTAGPLEPIRIDEPAAPDGQVPANLGKEVVQPVLPRSMGLGLSSWRERKRPIVLGLLVLLAIALSAGAFALLSAMRISSRDAGIRYFWQAFNPNSKGALVVIGVHFLDSMGQAVSADTHIESIRNGKQSALSSMESYDMVPLSDIVSYSKFTDLLTQRSLPYRTEGSAETTLEELRVGPVVLIGGFNNVWTMRLSSKLRYRFVPKGNNVNGIVDSRNPSIAWLYDNLQPANSNSQDYAIVASYYDTTIEQHVVIAAGIGRTGTIAAAEFLTTDKHLQQWLAESKTPPGKNVELVLSTNILDGEPGPPHVVASSVW